MPLRISLRVLGNAIRAVIKIQRRVAALAALASDLELLDDVLYESSLEAIRELIEFMRGDMERTCERYRYMLTGTRGLAEHRAAAGPNGWLARGGGRERDEVYERTSGVVWLTLVEDIADGGTQAGGDGRVALGENGAREDDVASVVDMNGLGLSLEGLTLEGNAGDDVTVYDGIH